MRSVTVGIQTESPPFEYITTNKAIGFNVDILDAITKRIPLEFIYIQKPYSKLKRDLADKKLDMVLMLYHSTENAKNFRLSKAYNRQNLSVFSSIEQSFSQNSMEKYVLYTDIPEICELVETLTGSKCKQIPEKPRRDIINNHVINGQIFYILPDRIGAHVVERNSIQNVWRVPLNEIEIAYSFGFHQDNDSLAKLLDENLDNLKETGEYEEIQKKWFGNIDLVAVEKTSTFESTTYAILLFLLAISLALIILLLKKNRRLTLAWESEKLLRYNAEYESAENKRRLSLIFDAIPHPLFIQDSENNIVFFNKSLRELLGIQDTEEAPEQIKSILEKDDQFKKIIQTTTDSIPTIQKIIGANGQLRIFEISRTMFPENDEKSIVLTMALDISKRFKAERKLEHKSALLSSIINSIPDLIFYKDTLFRYIGANTAFKKYNNFSDEEFVGKTDFELYDVKQAIDYHNIDRQVMEQNRPQRIEKWGILPNGSSALFDTVKVPFHNNDGELLGIVGISRDITHQYEIQKALTEAKSKAEESDKLKTIFLANISHEIRIPLNSIIGFSDLLLDMNLTIDQREDFIEMIRNSGNSLVQLVDDIIDLSKIESGNIVISKSEVKASQLLKEIYSLFKETLENPEYREIKLTIDFLPTPDEPFVEIDGFRVKQILSNLVGNAIRYTRRGEIHIGAVHKESFVEFYVDDREAIISDFLLKNIFDRNVFSGGIENYGGSGLNLIISRGLVKIMDGDISVSRSQRDSGIMFSFYIPVKQKAENPLELLPSSPTAILSSKNILIAEDEKNNFIFLEEALRKTGINIIWAMNGKEAMEQVALRSDIDIILMDIKMPVMDGYTATREIKKIRPNIPVIAQTAYASADEKARSLEAGCDAYLTKPIRPSYLIETITQFFS